jgi:hypothetical protein
VDLDLAAMRLGDPLHDRQTKPSTFGMDIE